MNHVVFQEPNFRCKIRRRNRPQSKPSGRLVYGKDAAEAQLALEKKGYQVLSVLPYNFANWKNSAGKATKAAIADVKAGRKPRFKAAIWAVLKEHLQDLFFGKCAYCEARFQHVAFGDVEHFRPKAQVTEELSHPGYYWLAYTFENYLPSCQLCNQGEAKKNHFPVKGKRAQSPADSLHQELALLLNPYQDKPLEHLKFWPSQQAQTPGWVSPVDERGEHSVAVYDLNREALVEIRREEQINVRARFKQLLLEENSEGLKQFTLDCIQGRRQFSAAAMAEIRDFYAKMGLPAPW